MENTQIPPKVSLPSKGTLMKSTIIAVCIAVALFFTVVLPAEYGIDYTGIGSMLGLTRMGEIKVSLVAEADQDKLEQHRSVLRNESVPSLGKGPVTPLQDSPITASLDTSIRNDSVTISLKPNEGKEIKLVMDKGAQVAYAWWSDGGKVNYDAHADSEPLNIKYHNYSKGSEQRSEGTLEAAFEGSHGWFWRNRTANAVSVTLQVRGLYSELKHIN